MPIEIEFRHDGGLVLKGKGMVTYSDIVGVNEVIYSSGKRLRRMQYQICDFTDAHDLDLTEEQALALAQQDREAGDANHGMMIAVILGGGRFRDLAQIWRDAVNHTGVVARLFDNRDEANAWLRHYWVHAEDQAPQV